MMKHFYLKVFLTGLLGWMSFTASAQLAANPIYIETQVHYGDYGEANHDLTNYVTYRVYVQFANSNNYLTAIFGEEPIFDCIQDEDTTLVINAPCGLFQHEFGAPYGFQELCLYPALIPTSEFDSYMTIGQECQSQVSCDIIGSLGDCEEWLEMFEGPSDGNYFDGASFFWDNYALYDGVCNAAYPSSLGHADANGRVLIAQLTTCGGIDGCINLSYKTQAMINAGVVEGVAVYNVCFDKANPCLANPMDDTPLVNQADCFGDDSQVILSDGGNGSVDYTLYNTSNVVVDSFENEYNGLNLTTLDPGGYYFTMIDSTGCRDTSGVFNIIEPDSLVLNAVLMQGVLCFGETTGRIQLNCSGGTGVLVADLNGDDYDCGTIVSGLPCDTYTITLTDENDCEATQVIDIPCPAELVYDPAVTMIECYGYDNGSIIGNITGGTDTLTAVWTYNDGAFETFTGPTPLNPSITGLDSGDYDISIVDDNGCPLTASFEITEPGEYIATGTSTDASCYNFCDGSVVYEISGGTFPYTITGTTPTGSPVNLSALCDGTYYIQIEDAAGCILYDTATIAEPTEILYTLHVVPVTCFGQCDGEVELVDVSGSFEGFTYALTPNAGSCVPPCSGSQVNFEDLCSGNYSILITDSEGCTKNVPSIFVDTPLPLQIVLTPHDVTCYGFGNGQVDIDHIGGTDPIIVTPGDAVIPTTITDLEPGTYTYTITDDNGCTETEDVIIDQPDSLIANVLSIDNASCGGSCDGRVFYEVSGGTFPYDYHLLPSGNAGAVNGAVSSLCAEDYQLVIMDLFDCVDTLEFTIEEPDPLVIDILLNAPTCTGMFDGSAEIQLSGGTGDLELFIEPESINSLQTDSVTYTLSELGEGQIFFLVVDSAECVLQDTLSVVPDIITDMVLTTFTSPETCWNEDDGTATVAVQNGNLPISYLWDDPNAQVTATADGLASSEQYTVIVTDAIGCTLSASAYVEPTIGCFFIATAITPNGDGSNDTWILGGFEFYPTAKVNVYNRWGQNVFSSKGYSTQWDGRYQGELLPVADYYFTIDYADDKEVIMGTVTIKY